jgi:hypothetical protein
MWFHAKAQRRKGAKKKMIRVGIGGQGEARGGWLAEFKESMWFHAKAQRRKEEDD